MALVYISWFDDYDGTWLATAQVDLQRDTLMSKYLQCLYFSVTIMATIGFGDIVPRNGYERGFAIIAMLSGSWCYAYCITRVVEQVSNMDMAAVRFKAHQDHLLEYMNARNLPRSLQTRILTFYEFQRRHAAVFHKCAAHFTSMLSSASSLLPH